MKLQKGLDKAAQKRANDIKLKQLIIVENNVQVIISAYKFRGNEKQIIGEFNPKVMDKIRPDTNNKVVSDNTNKRPKSSNSKGRKKLPDGDTGTDLGKPS